MWVRRLVTVTAYVSLTLAATAAAPLLLVAAWLASTHPSMRGAVPTLFFIIGYLWCETAGIVAAFWIWLRHGRDPAAFLERNYQLQYWWAERLKRIAERLFDLTFLVSGETALDGPAALMLPRHASIADTIIPMVFYAAPRRIRLRYVLKQELLVDPCLDIVGNRLPNLFVDRGGTDSEAARQAVAALVKNLPPDEGALIYVEGTRFSPVKHRRLRARYADNPDLTAQLVRWPGLLPPRLGGILAALDANPELDLLFCAHVGFEGSSRVTDLVNGAWQNARIRIHFWRIDHREIPPDPAGRRELLFNQWDRMQQWVSLNS